MIDVADGVFTLRSPIRPKLPPWTEELACVGPAAAPRNLPFIPCHSKSKLVRNRESDLNCAVSWKSGLPAQTHFAAWVRTPVWREGDKQIRLALCTARISIHPKCPYLLHPSNH